MPDRRTIVARPSIQAIQLCKYFVVYYLLSKLGLDDHSTTSAHGCAGLSADADEFFDCIRERGRVPWRQLKAIHTIVNYLATSNIIGGDDGLLQSHSFEQHP